MYTVGRCQFITWISFCKFASRWSQRRGIRRAVTSRWTGKRIPVVPRRMVQWSCWIGGPLDWIWLDWIWLDWILSFHCFGLDWIDWSGGSWSSSGYTPLGNGESVVWRREPHRNVTNVIENTSRTSDAVNYYGWPPLRRTACKDCPYICRRHGLCDYPVLRPVCIQYPKAFWFRQYYPLPPNLLILSAIQKPWSSLMSLSCKASSIFAAASWQGKRSTPRSGHQLFGCMVLRNCRCSMKQ